MRGTTRVRGPVCEAGCAKPGLALVKLARMLLRLWHSRARAPSPNALLLASAPPCTSAPHPRPTPAWLGLPIPGPAIGVPARRWGCTRPCARSRARGCALPWAHPGLQTRAPRWRCCRRGSTSTRCCLSTRVWTGGTSARGTAMLGVCVCVRVCGGGGGEGGGRTRARGSAGVHTVRPAGWAHAQGKACVGQDRYDRFHSRPSGCGCSAFTSPHGKAGSVGHGRVRLLPCPSSPLSLSPPAPLSLSPPAPLRSSTLRVRPDGEWTYDGISISPYETGERHRAVPSQQLGCSSVGAAPPVVQPSARMAPVQAQG